MSFAKEWLRWLRGGSTDLPELFTDSPFFIITTYAKKPDKLNKINITYDEIQEEFHYYSYPELTEIPDKIEIPPAEVERVEIEHAESGLIFKIFKNKEMEVWYPHDFGPTWPSVKESIMRNAEKFNYKIKNFRPYEIEFKVGTF